MVASEGEWLNDADMEDRGETEMLGGALQPAVDGAFAGHAVPGGIYLDGAKSGSDGDAYPPGIHSMTSCPTSSLNDRPASVSSAAPG